MAQTRPRPARTEIETLADLALAAPPELAADVLIRIAGSAGTADRKWRIELLERAFALAPAARFPYKLVGAVGRASHTDSDTGVTWRALEAGVDTLSLQCRVVGAMLDLDRAQALELFARIPLPQLAPLTCKDGLKPSVEAYYALVRRLFETGYSAEDRREGRHLEMLERQVRSVSSPFQLEPVARLLKELRLGKVELAGLLNAYAAAMKQIAADDRSFTSGTRHGLTQLVWDLTATCRQLEISIFPFVEAYRSYLARHVAGARCADSADLKGEGATIANMISLFNSSLRQSAPELAQVAPISDDEMKPARVQDDRGQVYDFWDKSSTRPLLVKLKELRFGTRPPDARADSLTVEQRKEPAWEAKVRDYMKELEAWEKDHGESAAHYFHQMCFIYVPLIELIPPGPLRNSVIASYISFLRLSTMERENPPEWLMEFRRLLHLGDSTPEELAAIRQQIRAAGSAAMSLYEALDRLAPERPNR